MLWLKPSFCKRVKPVCQKAICASSVLSLSYMHAAYWLSLPIPFLCTPSLPLPQGHTHSFDCTFSHTYTLSYTHTLTHTHLVTHSLTHSHTRSHTHTQTRKQSQSMTERGYLTVVNFTILTDLLSATHDKFLLAPICTAYTLSPTRHPPTHPCRPTHTHASSDSTRASCTPLPPPATSPPSP